MKRSDEQPKPPARGLGALSPSCREASRLQSEALDHPLTLTQRIGLGIHLLLCQWCRRYGRQIRFLHHTAHEHPDQLTEAIPQRLSDDARQRIKEKLQAGEK